MPAAGTLLAARCQRHDVTRSRRIRLFGQLDAFCDFDVESFFDHSRHVFRQPLTQHRAEQIGRGILNSPLRLRTPICLGQRWRFGTFIRLDNRGLAHVLCGYGIGSCGSATWPRSLRWRFCLRLAAGKSHLQGHDGGKINGAGIIVFRLLRGR